MSCKEIGSPSRSRAAVITRSTARRCASIVSARHAELSLANSVCCIFSQGFAQLWRHGDGNNVSALALHAGDLLLAASHQLFARWSVPPVLEVHRDAVLSQFTEAHAQDDLVEGDELRHEFTRHSRRYQHEAVLECFDNFGRALTQEHLAAAPLPTHVIDVVDIADQVRLFKPDDVPVFIRAHLRPLLTTLLPDRFLRLP